MSKPTSSADHAGRWRVAFDRALAREALGDLLLLADEAPSTSLQLDARRLLAQRLLAQDRLQLARDQILAVLSGDPSDEAGRALLATLDVGAGGTTRRRPSAPAPGGRVVLFSGHMIDAPERPTPRFPAEKESIAASAIAAALDDLRLGPRDLAVSGAACGGDTLFAEACLARGLPLQVHLQFEEPQFVAASVAFAGTRWVDRYRRIVAHPRTTVRVMPRELGPGPPDGNPYERNNRWMLYCALTGGTGPVQFVALWNGQGGDGPGGTKHMVETVQAYSGQVTILDTTRLW